MPCSFVSRCKGDVWWLEKQSVKSGRQHYPKMIKVGKLGHERVYLPVKTCHNTNDKYSRNWNCSCCGHSFVVSAAEENPFDYCPGCGAKVVD